MWKFVLLIIMTATLAGYDASLALEDPAFPAQELTGSSCSRYDFTFYYGDGSGDSYTGYVYAPTTFQTEGPDIDTGDRLYRQPESMGGGALNGYYEITAIADGYDSSTDAQEYITSYDDGNTGRTSYTFYADTGRYTTDGDGDRVLKTQGSSSAEAVALYVADRRYTAEAGFVYDPAVPDSDAYFGNTDICYDFDTGSSAGNNFLAGYIEDLPYWNQPDLSGSSYLGTRDYAGVCSEVAGALILAYWDQHGHDGLLPTVWGDNTTSSGYADLIWELCQKMSYDPASGTPNFFMESGLENYAMERDVDLTAVFGKLNAGIFTIIDEHPLIITISGSKHEDGGSEEFNHAAVARGYWNDGRVLVNLGYGSPGLTPNDDALTNVALYYNSMTNTFSYKKPGAASYVSVDNIRINDVLDCY